MSAEDLAASTSADDRAVGAPERLHPLFLVTGIGAGLRGLTGAYALLAYLAVSGRLGTALGGAAALLVFAGVWLLLYWRRFEFRVGDNEIRIDSGILSRTHRSIPFDRIQDVDITQGPIARVLGLAKVTFETGGGSALPGSEEGVLHAITLERAQELRDLVRARRSKATLAPAGDVEAETERSPTYAMDLKRLLLAGTFNFSLALFAGLIGATQTFGDFMGFDPLSRGFWERVLSAGDPVRDFILSHRVAAAAAGAVLLVLVGLLTGIIRTVLRDYGFRLDRTGVGVRRRRGLLTRTDVTLPVKRAQAAIIASGPLRDWFGWSELKLQSLARDEGSGAHVLAPLATEVETGGILEELGWKRLPNKIRWIRVSSAYVWGLAVGISPLFVVAAAQAVYVFPLGLAFIVGLLAVLVTRWLAWRRTGFALDDDRLLVRKGWWRRRITILPVTKIQSADVAESFVSRWFGIASLNFGVAGAGGLGAHSIPAIPRQEARKLRDQLLGFPG